MLLNWLVRIRSLKLICSPRTLSLLHVQTSVRKLGVKSTQLSAVDTADNFPSMHIPTLNCTYVCRNEYFVSVVCGCGCFFYSGCEMSTCSFINGSNRLPVPFISHPGSGNTWLRALLEMASGICTGLLYTATYVRTNRDETGWAWGRRLFSLIANDVILARSHLWWNFKKGSQIDEL